MVSQRERELLRGDTRARGSRLSAADRENILKPYLPDPSDLRNRSRRKKTPPRKTPIRTFLKSQLHQLVYTIIHIFFGIATRLVHSYHAVVDRIFALVYYHHRTPELIRKDVKNLDRLPEHLSVVLSLRREDDALAVLMDEVAELAAWSVSAGIPVLSVYEKTGLLKSCIPLLHKVITKKLASYYGSPSQQPTLNLFAPHHPVYQPPDETVNQPAQKSNTHSLTLLLLSATDGRETLVDLTKTLAEMSQNGKLSPADITMELVDAEISEITTHPLQPSGAVEDPAVAVKPEPDLLLVFGPILKLDGYPPWHIRLTEMFCTGDNSSSMNGSGGTVEYQGFLRGLWHFAGAQMRFGR
ncbi:Undecaprenyl diphosphate synthase [Aspergillus ambiguus]|uniref:ditrans,polycis-polyprenyl diphosphate synthase n=1 Tax=Aspergillus ambiguus TaxID=176160 RepID=UPI003CCD3A70